MLLLTTNMEKGIVLIFYLFVFGNTLNAQLPPDYGSPVKWDKNIDRSKFIMRGIDTLTHDSILIEKEKYVRQNQEGSILEQIVYSNLNRLSWNDDGLKLTGYWTMYYDSGEIRATGKVVCNRKFGEWLYFYKSGQIRKFEKYDSIEIIDSRSNGGYLNGSYLEYHPNRKIKISGSYRIIEENVEYFIFDSESYKEQKKCCTWTLKSIKNGT